MTNKHIFAAIITMVLLCIMAIPEELLATGSKQFIRVPQGKNSAALKEAVQNMSSKDLYKKGEQLLNKGQADSALFYFEVINNREPANDEYTYAQSLHQAGIIYYTHDSYARAMELYMTCLEISERAHYDKILPTLYKDIGNIYSMFHDYEQSSELYKKTLDMARKQHDVPLANKMLNNLIFAYTPKTPLAQYKKWLSEIKAHPEKRPRYGYDLLMIEGQILSYENRNEEAISFFKKAVTYSKTHKLDQLSCVSAYSCLIDMYLETGQRDSALIYLMRNKAIAEETGNTALLTMTLNNLSTAYAKTDKELSLKYKSQYLMLSDSIFNANEFNGIRNALFFHEMGKNTKTIDDLSALNQAKSQLISSQRYGIIILIVCLLIFVVLTVAIVRKNKLIKTTYQNLFAKNQEDIITKNAYAQAIKTLEEKIALLKSENDKQTAKTPTKTVSKADDEEPSTTPKASSEKSIKLSEEARNELLSAILHIMEHTKAFCDSDFGIEKLATMVHSNARYVSLVINVVYQENFRTFLNRYRIKEAMLKMNDLDTNGNYTLRAIAESVGYKSQANFINVFTRITGIKPSTYQKMVSEKQLVTIENENQENN